MLVSLWAVVLCLLSNVPIFAQEAKPPDLDLTYRFGQTAIFTLRFDSEQDTPSDENRPLQETINHIVLHLRAGAEPTQTHIPDLIGTTATVTRDLELMPLPPFSNVTYWWTYRKGEEVIETDKGTFQYTDNRYTWHTATQDGIQIHWVDGDRDKMILALDTAQTALSRIDGALQSSLNSDVDIYIYPSHSDLAAAMQLAGRTWVGAAAYPDLDVILVAISPAPEGLLTMDRDIPHELTHKAIYDMLGDQGYASLPTWLNEGLAVYFEARPDPTHAVALETARQSGELLPLSDLCVPFPEQPERARLAYAQSASIVNYLRQHYGWSAIRELLWAYADGLACNTGVLETLGTDLPHLDRAWRIWLESEQQPREAGVTWAPASVFLRDAGPWLLLLVALLLPVLLLVAGGRR